MGESHQASTKEFPFINLDPSLISLQ